LPGVTLLPPIQRVFDVRKDERLGTDVRDALYRAPMQADPFAPAADFAGRHNEFCRGALALALAFQRRHARQRRAARPCPPALTGPEHPAVFLNGMRKGGELERQQSRASEHTRQAQRWAAFLFVLSLASYETYAELLPDRGWPLVSYIALLLGIWLIAAVACRRKIQTIAEDYRGLREMMRVQVAWWSAGINRMVDRIHLRTIDTDVRLVREAAAAISMWSVLRCSWLQTCDVTAAPPPDAPESARPAPLYRDWITEQAAYFFTQSHAQAGAKRLAEAAFEVTFATALAAFGVLFVVGHALKGRFSPHLATLAMPALLAWPLLAALTAGGLLWAITGNWRGDTAERKRAWLAWALSVPVLLLAAEALRRALGWGDLPEWATWTLDWLGPALFVVLLGLLVFQRIPDGARAFNVPKFADSQKLPGALLLFALLLSGAVAFAPNFARLHAANDPDGFGEAFRALILTQAVLALGSSGMVRWYTERRNHLAQAAAYDDMLRMFRRAQAWLHERGDQPLDRPAQQALVALGELALDENAAWLKAHRERPIEAIAGT